jgi:hypothetical protein
MGSGGTVYTSSSIRIDSGIQDLLGGYTDIQRGWRSLKPTLETRKKVGYFK